MKATPVRYKLAQIGKGNKVKIVGKYANKVVFEYSLIRILLTDVFNATTQEYLCDHLWLDVSKGDYDRFRNNVLTDFLVVGEGIVYEYKAEKDLTFYANYSIEKFVIQAFMIPIVFEDKYYFGYYVEKQIPKCLIYTAQNGIRFESLESRQKILNNGYGVCFIPNSTIYYLEDKETNENEIVKYYVIKEETETNVILQRVNEEKLSEEKLKGTQETLYLYKDIKYFLKDCSPKLM